MLFALPVVMPAPGLAQDRPFSSSAVAGRRTYRVYCAVCHGQKGKGDGPLAESLRSTPPDLTLIARDNGGAYPAEQVARIIDGREPLLGHGGPDMPVWGDAFQKSDPEAGEGRTLETTHEQNQHERRDGQQPHHQGPGQSSRRRRHLVFLTKTER